MPMKVTRDATQSATDYGNPFVGPVNHTHQLAIVVSGLTTAEVDAKGFLKPGLPLKLDGTLVGATEAVGVIVVEGQKVADGNAAGDLAAAGTVRVAVARLCLVNRDIVEDNLGRALTAAEVAGFSLAGSLCGLV